MNFFLNSTTSGGSLFTDKFALYLIIAFCVVMLSYIIVNAFWRKIRKDKYSGTRFTTKNIAYITMLSSVSVVATMVVSITLPVTVLPPIRIAIEGLMIKITGYLFGPIIGIISATITDFLVMLFVPSYVHYVYIFSIILTGFLAGIAGVLRDKLKKHTWVIFLLINMFVIFFASGGSYLAFTATSPKIKLSQAFLLDKNVVGGIIIAGGTITLLIIYGALWYFWKSNQLEKLQNILPIILLAVVAEYVITVLIASYADMTFLSPVHTKDYGLTLIPRLAMAPFKILINSTIIYITWKTVSPLVEIDNRN